MGITSDPSLHPGQPLQEVIDVDEAEEARQHGAPGASMEPELKKLKLEQRRVQETSNVPERQVGSSGTRSGSGECYTTLCHRVESTQT